jgi:hypothetical protein
MTNRVGRKGGLDSMRLPEFEALARVDGQALEPGVPKQCVK